MNDELYKSSCKQHDPLNKWVRTYDPLKDAYIWVKKEDEMNDVLTKEETQNEAETVMNKMTDQAENILPTTFSRLTLMTALHGGYIVFAQSGNDQVVLFAGCLRECLEFMGKSVERA